MINPARLNKRVKVYAYVMSENKLGQTVGKLKKIKEVWAEIRPLRTKEYIEANLLDSKTTYKITIRYFEGLTEDMYLEYKEKQFAITSIADVNMRHETYELMATEKQKKKEAKV